MEQVRCVLHVSDAFFIGEDYTVDVEAAPPPSSASAHQKAAHAAAQAVGGSATTFRVATSMEDVTVDLSRASAQVKARIFPLLPASAHWSQVRDLPCISPPFHGLL